MYKRNDEKIYKRLKSDYDYLVSLGYEVVGVFLQGSQNYDLDHSGSDIDTKAIVLPKFEDLMMGNPKASTTLILESDEHIDVKDIRVMFDNFLKQNINFLEILFTKYRYVNPDYETYMDTIYENRESIAHYDNYKAVNCIVGMMYQKHKALTHPYPATKDKIDKYGYDGKQLHHILRCYEFLQRYIKGESFESCLFSKDTDRLIKIKENKEYSLGQAKYAADITVEKGQLLKEKYAKNNPQIIDESVPKLFDEILLQILTDHCKRNFK